MTATGYGVGVRRSVGHTVDQTAGVVLPAAVWAKVCLSLKGELGEDTFGSWLGQAGVRQSGSGDLVLVTPTGIARDWVRRNAWRRTVDLWGQLDPLGRRLDLKSRVEFDAEAGAAPVEALPQPVPAMPANLVPPASEVELIATIPPADDLDLARAAGLQDRYRFDTFVPGPANEFAYAVARRVGAWSDGHFNPVIFHGPYGFGKTHLLNAIAWEAMRVAPHRKVIYLTAERFLTSFVRAMMERRGPAFKDELRTADLLLIDDVHFIAGKQSSQEELFHTLAALTQDGRRVVFTTDRAPGDLAEMDGRLRSHLQAGLVCGIEPADRTLRLGILERKLIQLGRQQGQSALAARPEVLQFLADRFTDSVRELEGALNTLVARSGEKVASLGLEEAQAILRPHLRGGEKRITVDDIQKATAEHYGMKQ